VTNSGLWNRSDLAQMKKGGKKYVDVIDRRGYWWGGAKANGRGVTEPTSGREKLLQKPCPEKHPDVSQLHLWLEFSIHKGAVGGTTGSDNKCRARKGNVSGVRVRTD